MCFATVLFPQPAGPVTSQMCWSLTGRSAADVPTLLVTLLESAAAKREAVGEDGILWRPDDIAPEDDGLWLFTATEVLYESIVALGN